MKAIDGRGTVARAIKGDLYKTLREALTQPLGKSSKSFAQEYVNIMLKEAKKNPNGPVGTLIAKQLLTDNIIEKLDAETDKYLARDIDFIRFRIMNTLYDKQRDVFLDKDRKKIIISSRRVGKTELAARLLLEDSVYPGHHAAFISLKFENAIKQCFPIVESLAESLGLSIERSSKNDGEILFSNGSNIIFKGNSNKTEADKLLGYKFSCVVIDEAQNQIGLMYLLDTVLRPALIDYEDSRLVLIGTPPRVPKTAVETIWKNFRDWKKYSWDMRCNPFIHNVDEYIQSICDEKGITEDAPFIQREMFGNWVYDTEALVYKGYKTYTEIPSDFVPEHIWIGVDFGYVDYNGMCSLVADKNGVCYVFNERKFNKSSVSEICENLEEVRKDVLDWALKKNPSFDLRHIQVVTDTNEPSVAYEMQVTYHVQNVVTAYKYDKQTSISQLSDLLRTKIYIPKGGFLDDECQRTVYKRDDADNLTTDIDDSIFHPDILDALRYATRNYLFTYGA